MYTKKLKYGGRATISQSSHTMYDGRMGDFRPTTEMSREGRRGAPNLATFEHIKADYIKAKNFGYIEVKAEEAEGIRLFDIYKSADIIRDKFNLRVEFLVIGEDVYRLDTRFLNKKKDGFREFKGGEPKKDTSHYNFKGKGNKFGLFKAEKLTSKLIENL